MNISLSRNQGPRLDKQAGPASKHSALYLERHDIGESVLFDLAHMRDLADALQMRIEYASKRYEHVARGGRPDDLPAKWKGKAK